MQRRSSNTADIRLLKLNYAEIIAALKRYAEKVVAKGAKAVILIGSLARGDYTAYSDADVVVISDNVPKRFIDRITDFIDPTLPIDIDPRVYTTEEILRMAKEGKKIIKEIVDHGKVLAGNSEIINILKMSLARTI